MALRDLKSRLCGPSDLNRLLSERPELEDELEKRGEKYRVGLWRWRPRFLQVFRNAITMTVLLFLFATLEGSLVSGERPQVTLAAPLAPRATPSVVLMGRVMRGSGAEPSRGRACVCPCIDLRCL